MQYRRNYVQFGDLVFDEVDMVEEDDYTSSFKTFDTEYTFRHGSYAPQKGIGGLLKMGSVSMTLTLNMKKIPCEQRPYYIRFVKSQLNTQGKLWAIENNTLMWAYAYMTSFSSSANARKDTYEMDVNFDLPEGVWHKADKQKTFLVPWDVCDFMDCLDYKDVKPCRRSVGDCCNCSKTEYIFCDCCDPCDHLEKEYALCYQEALLQQFYANCGAGLKIIYNCDAAERFFGDFLSDERLGEKFCASCGEVAAGILYSDTDIPTSGVKITIHGQVSDLAVTINDNTNVIKGDYEGVLEIYPDGSVYSSAEGCNACDPLPVSRWVIPPGNDYGWTINPGNNRIVIDGGSCCSFCAYVETDALTY